MLHVHNDIVARVLLSQIDASITHVSALGSVAYSLDYT